MTLRIPRIALYILAAGAALGIGIAAYVILKEPSKDCLDSSGAAVACDTDGSMSQAEYDQMLQDQAAAAAADKAAAVAAKCRQQTGGLMRSLQELDSRLSVGLAYNEYSTQVGNARVSYDRVPLGALSRGCVTKVAIHLEDAMNAYAKADNTWNDCLTSLSCDTDSIDPDLQAKWADATGAIQKAKSGLSSLAEPPEASVSIASDDAVTDETTTGSDEGFQPETDDCVSPSTGEPVDCDYPGAVDRTVYEEHAN